METGIVEESVKQSIRKNGFPKKAVRLPFKQVFESCKSHGIALKEVLKNLREKNVLGKIEGDYITFYPPGTSSTEKNVDFTEDQFDFSKINPADLKTMAEAAKERLKNMTPKQAVELRKMILNMSDEYKANVMKLFEQMHGGKK